MISSLILLNCLTILYFLYHLNREEKNEVVATVGSEKITREEWLSELEKNYGKETLKKIIDEKVIEQIAKKYQITISDATVEREMLLLKTVFGTKPHIYEEEWKKEIKIQLLLEEILTKDVVIPEEDLQQYYEEHPYLYKIEPFYHVSQIVVKTLPEAEQIIKELEQGTSFSSLAKERSIDSFSSSQGGDIGFIPFNEGRFPRELFDYLENISPGNWTNPIVVHEDYVILFLHEKILGREYSFDEVKDDIRREMAIEQMVGQPNLTPFWKELNVTWFYEKY